MPQSANILFISLNGHQKRYFGALANYLQGRYRIFHVEYGLADTLNFAANAKLPPKLGLTDKDIEEIIHFLYYKGQRRKFGLLRGFLHSKKVLENQALAAVNYFYHYITTNNIDLVCVWNGTLVPLAAATRVARRLGKKTLYFENGCLPGTTTVDPCGVNNNSSLIGKDTSFYEAVEIEAPKLTAVYNRPLAVRELKSAWYRRLIKQKPKGRPENIVLPERYVFVPFQVHDDTQVLLHSAYIKDMRSLVETVIPAVERYNAVTGDKIWVVMKEHPSDFGRVDYSDIAEKYQGNKVQLLKYYPTPELIKNATGIITLNSSVGIEALLAHKPVITLGNALYNVPGVVKHTTPGELAGAMEWIDQPVNHTLLDKFLYYLRYIYLAEGSWHQPDEIHVASVRGKIDIVLSN